MIGFAFLAAAAGAIAMPEYNTRRVVQSYPTWAVEEEKSTAAVISYWVDPKGRVYDCQLLANIGDRKLAGEVCGLVRRVKMRPAVDADAMPITAHVVTMIRLFVPGTQQAQDVAKAKMEADFVLEVNNLPSEVGETYVSTVISRVDRNGQVVECYGNELGHAVMDKLACEQISHSKLPIGKDRKGQPVDYITTIQIEFVTKP